MWNHSSIRNPSGGFRGGQLRIVETGAGRGNGARRQIRNALVRGLRRPEEHVGVRRLPGPLSQAFGGGASLLYWLLPAIIASVARQCLVTVEVRTRKCSPGWVTGSAS